MMAVYLDPLGRVGGECNLARKAKWQGDDIAMHPDFYSSCHVLAFPGSERCEPLWPEVLGAGKAQVGSNADPLLCRTQKQGQ